MTFETYGFKNWEELNDEARDEFEEELMSQMAYELDTAFYRVVNDWLGDLVDAFNMHPEDAQYTCGALLSVWFDENHHLVESGADLADHVDNRLNKLESGERDTAYEISRKRVDLEE